jgi:hypothetical protein
MKLQVVRFSSESDSTNGLLFDITEGVKFLAYTLEDERRKEKVMSETRIPAGTYEVKLRTEGGHHNKYASRYGSMHKGMLWLQDVPNFKWILIHCGNTDEHTAGCLLVGDSQENNQIKENGFIGSSSNAYKRIYPSIAEAVENEKVTIEYIDVD